MDSTRSHIGPLSVRSHFRFEVFTIVLSSSCIPSHECFLSRKDSCVPFPPVLGPYPTRILSFFRALGPLQDSRTTVDDERGPVCRASRSPYTVLDVRPQTVPPLDYRRLTTLTVGRVSSTVHS